LIEHIRRNLGAFQRQAFTMHQNMFIKCMDYVFKIMHNEFYFNLCYTEDEQINSPIIYMAFHV